MAVRAETARDEEHNQETEVVQHLLFNSPTELLTVKYLMN